MKTKLQLIVIGVAMLAGTTNAQQVQIDSLDSNGELTWTAPSGSVCSVEWTDDLVPSADWRQDWGELKNISCTNDTQTAQVPMFFRVTCWTNGLFWNVETGNRATLSATNAFGQCWTQNVEVVGTLEVPALPYNSYLLSKTENIYDELNPPVDISGNSLVRYRRSTDTAVLEVADFEREYIIYTNAPIGTTWAYEDYNGNTWSATIETNETISVPAGTFSCQRYRKTLVGSMHPKPWIDIWFEPKGGVRKVHFYLLSNPAAAPSVYELLSTE
ncbi:hypothetical protein [Pontiella sulfatireligans]|uniref:Uncharacterized protein n=1 Tax=Pontiella sulfatireligans TaxID=2750658 RepID=A0A6C2UM95_9BACT|nr:hypothetical protein [Pontiella sulfatireligans]VGO21119.1 hypothetical protein SCARR_03189 [Pontiella sulfatireligans]